MELQFWCPECDKPNLWWNLDTQLGQCFTCQVGYNQLTLKRLVGEVASFAEVWEEIHEASPKRPPRVISKSSIDTHWQAEWYLHKVRKCHRKDLRKVGVWYDEEVDRVCFPIQRIPRAGELPETMAASLTGHGGYMSRSTDPDTGGWLYQSADPGKEGYWFNPLGIRPEEQTVVLVEGVFDVLSPRLLKCAIAILGTKLSEYGEYALRNAKRVLIWLDEDKAGYNAAMFHILQQVPRAIVINYSKEPGDCSPEEAREVIRNALCHKVS